MKTVIIDDEQPAIRLLSKFVEKVPFLQLEMATTNAFEAIEMINNGNVDLLLLDIEMPDITGIEFLQSLKKQPLVIFTTAYEKYAIKGYELDIVDYLMKPIPFNRFLKAINKAHLQFSNNFSNNITSRKDEFLIVKVEYQNKKIAIQEILFVEGLKDYVKIYTIDEMILTRLNLKGIEAKLPADSFIRIHRSYIIAFDKISSFQKGQVFIEQKSIPIGETYRKSLLDKLKNT